MITALGWLLAVLGWAVFIKLAIVYREAMEREQDLLEEREDAFVLAFHARRDSDTAHRLLAQTEAALLETGMALAIEQENHTRDVEWLHGDRS